ncbi:MAG: hypothetical protein LBK29_04560 [Oscillospiraceae bacterium]|nr:hypothetical protein [Oscillospiraceae bacterium]
MMKKFCELLSDRNFIDGILQMEKGSDIRDAFRSHGVELDQVEFSKLCEVLVENLKSRKMTDLEVLSSCSAVDFEISKKAKIEHFSKDCDSNENPFS